MIEARVEDYSGVRSSGSTCEAEMPLQLAKRPPQNHLRPTRSLPMSQTLIRPAPVLFMPKKQAVKPMTRALKVVSEYEPAGDQPTAIRELVAGVNQAEIDQVLLG